ncbi:hypothetical protein AAFP35_10760 [Gordonia sp. CPCC 206044]|uniref:hypothetical protein n=1 Tax=Gordonia sp. CPCC 206044 TaxID=3140793 RepID=UPI003AF3A9D0
MLGPDPLNFSRWGALGDGGFGCWHQIGDDPQRWPVLVTDLVDVWLYDRHGVAAFLVGVLSGDFTSEQIDSRIAEYPEFLPRPN